MLLHAEWEVAPAKGHPLLGESASPANKTPFEASLNLLLSVSSSKKQGNGLMPLIGIDLGTTHSLVAAYRNETPELIPNAHGDYLTPSVVSLDDNGEYLIGRPARERLVSHPEKTVHAFKRFMGSDRQWKLGKDRFRAEELSALVLKSLKADAEAYLGETVTEAVISVPAYFNDTQRNATRQAARLAGLEVPRLVNEPTAAALVYGLNDVEDDKQYLVLDLGGGTFDVTLLEYFEGVFEVHASAGDNFLGGEDFTKALSDWIENEARSRFKLTLPGHRLYQLAEQAKRALGNSEQVIIPVSETETLELTETEFNRLCVPLVERIRTPIIGAMQDAELRPEDFDDVVLIGGATRMSLFHQFVTRLFKRFPRQTEDPDHVVAKGAALVAAMVARNEDFNEVVMTDVMPYSLGVGIHNDADPNSLLFNPIIERNQTIPISRENRYVPVNNEQTELRIPIYQGESRYVDNNLALGEIKINLGEGARNRYVDVRFTYDVNGILEVVTETGHGETNRMVIQQTPGKMSDEEVEAALARLAELKIHPRDQSKNRAWLSRAERLYEQSVGDRREQIGALMDAFSRLLATQDTKLIDKESDRFVRALDALEGEAWF